MSIVSKVLTLFLGNKEERDLKEINPFVEKIQKETPLLTSLSNDALRDRTAELKREIREHISAEEKEIAELRASAENEEDVNRKEDLYNQVDKLEKQILEKIEAKLDEILPVAFAIVKETARRFKENEVLEVTARDWDRNLAATRPSITVEGKRPTGRTGGWQEATR